MGTPIVQCTVADPYILIMSDEGTIMMLTLKQEVTGARLVLTKPLISNVCIILFSLNTCNPAADHINITVTS